jgi:hypothetical protein
MPPATERLSPGSSHNTRILSAVAETMTCAILCNPSVAGNASRIWRAASPGDGACKKQILDGSSTASLGFNRRFSTIEIVY